MKIFRESVLSGLREKWSSSEGTMAEREMLVHMLLLLLLVIWRFVTDTNSCKQKGRQFMHQTPEPGQEAKAKTRLGSVRAKSCSDIAVEEGDKKTTVRHLTQRLLFS